MPRPTTDAAGNNITYYAVFFPHGMTITQNGMSSCAPRGFCAYHSAVKAQLGVGEFYYGVHPDMEAGSGCDTGCGKGLTPFANYTSVASHEAAETITDPEVNLATADAPPLGWYDDNGLNSGEVGDLCNGQQASIVGGDGQTYTVQKLFSNIYNNCIVVQPIITVDTLSPVSVAGHCNLSDAITAANTDC